MGGPDYPFELKTISANQRPHMYVDNPRSLGDGAHRSPALVFILCLVCSLPPPMLLAKDIGKEISIPRHLQDGEEFTVPLQELLAHGRDLFNANWTPQEGGGRPLTKGNGKPLSDPSHRLEFPRGFNRISGPDANSCFGCHNSPVSGGNGDIAANVFVLGQRFDFATFDGTNTTPTVSATDESGKTVTLQTIANSRATPGMFGSGYIEMLARQMTVELRTTRDSMQPGESISLSAKGVAYGTLRRRADGTWDTSEVQGIPAPSLTSTNADNPPSLTIRPFHQAGNVVSVREFSNNAFNHHHGIQSVERFGYGTDPDGDGFTNELTRADVTAVAVFQATMAVPGRVIPNDPELEAAVLVGEERFTSIGCVRCHIPSLALTPNGWVFTEPNPFHPANNLKIGDAPMFSVDLTSDALPQPRVKPIYGIVYVPAFTDLKLHDICSGPNDPNVEVIDMNQPAGSAGFFAGNPKFLTRKLWGVGKKPNYFHHGQYVTMRQAILAHAGEAQPETAAFMALNGQERDCIIEFLKTLQVLPAGTTNTIVDETGTPKLWPPTRFTSITRSGQQLTLNWTGSASLYQVQRTTTLTSPQWQNLGTPVAARTFSSLMEGDAAFFRVMVLSP